MNIEDEKAFAARRNANVQEVYRAMVRCNNAIRRNDALLRKITDALLQKDVLLPKLAEYCA